MNYGVRRGSPTGGERTVYKRKYCAVGLCYRNRALSPLAARARTPVKKLQIFHVTAYENLIHDDKAPSQYVTVAVAAPPPRLDTYILQLYFSPCDSERVIQMVTLETNF